MFGGVAAPAREIWSADIADEQRVTGQDLLRRRRNIIVNHQNRDALRGVTGSLEKPQRYTADLNLIPVFDRSMGELGAGLRAENYVGARTRRKLAVPTHKIGMKVCLDDMFDLEALGFRFGDVLIDVALRIDYRRFAR
jgi:hypothetical protein